MASTIMESLFQRTLEDLVKGLRVQMIGEARYIATHLEEIRKEIKSTDSHTKAVALQKLTYINMLAGVDMEWAAFHVIEVMSMTKFEYKKIGYLAASQSFHEGIDVLLLVTNQLRKDLNSTNEYEVGLALECLSCIATPDLAQELTPEVFALLASGRTYVRRRAALVTHKLFSKYPDAVRIACKRLVEKMEDSDTMVACAAVSVFCEMAINDPRSCIPLAPEFYKLLINSKHNWLAIKVVKIFGVLASIEPRLVRKISEPLCELMRKTSAKSLLLECIRTVIVGMPDHKEAMKLAVEKLKELLEENDPNLIYLGLQALAALMPAHPWAVSENKSIIVRSLNDEDRSIQMASLQLILGMVTDNNIVETVQVLMQFAGRSDPGFCNELIGAILTTCSRGLYELVPDFSWYVSVLGDIAKISSSTHGKELERQFVDIGIRVKEVREDLVIVARGILMDPTLLEHSSLHRVLSAVAWIAGEYVQFSRDPVELIEALLQPRTRLLPPAVQAVYLQALLKVFVYFASLYLESITDQSSTKTEILEQEQSSQEKICDTVNLSTSSDDTEVSNLKSDVFVNEESFKRVLDLVDMNVGPLVESNDVELQERACNLLGVVTALRKNINLPEDVPSSSSGRSSLTKEALEMTRFLRSVFSQELGPVSVFAQRRVVVPDGLVLQDNLDSLKHILQDDELLTQQSEEWNIGVSSMKEWDVPGIVHKNNNDTSKDGESASLLTQHRQRHGTYYLPVEKDLHHDDEYPPPQVSQFDVPSTSPAPDIMKLAENSSLWAKTRRAKPRPVVIRLDDTEENLGMPTKAKKDLKDDVLSSAIRDVLVADKNKHIPKSEVKEGILGNTSSQHQRKSHRRGKRHDRDLKQEGSNTSDKHSHSKGVSVSSERDSIEKGKHRTNHEHSGHRSRHRAKSPVTLNPQTPIIPDFLL